jgi:hypothetical protein
MSSDGRWQLLRRLTYYSSARVGLGTLLAFEEHKGLEQNHSASGRFPELLPSKVASSTNSYRFPVPTAGDAAVSLS